MKIPLNVQKKIMKDSRNILEDSRRFQKILENSRIFQKILEDSRRVLCSSADSVSPQLRSIFNGASTFFEILGCEADEQGRGTILSFGVGLSGLVFPQDFGQHLLPFFPKSKNLKSNEKEGEKRLEKEKKKKKKRGWQPPGSPSLEWQQPGGYQGVPGVCVAPGFPLILAKERTSSRSDRQRLTKTSNIHESKGEILLSFPCRGDVGDS